MTTLIHSLKRCAAIIGASFMISAGSHAAGLMTPAAGNLPALEIREHHVDVVIDDGYAVTTIDQVFYNPHNSELEARYSFPIPEKASVGEFTYWIDGKPVTGEVLEKVQAQNIYQQEKAQGRETALTEQDGHHSFDSLVYPVRPRQDVRIRLVYIQPVHLDSGIGRYVYPLEEGGTDEEKLAFWTYNDAVSEAFSFNLRLRSSYPVDGVRLPQHPQAVATALSEQEWAVSMANGRGMSQQAEEALEEGLEEGSTPQQSNTQLVHTLDTDIVLYWRLKEGLPGSIDMITYKDADKSRGTFMMTLTPGDDLSTISQGRDWVFVLDLSGSMVGKYQSLTEGVSKGLAKLRTQDRFRIVLFNNSAMDLTKGYIDVTPENVAAAIQTLENTRPNGSTNLYAGLERGIKGLDSDRPSAIILVTDGVANVGVTEKQRFLTLLEQHDVRLFSFVMGNSANRPLLEGMTKISNGFAMNVSNSDDIVGKLLLATDKLTHEAFNDIELKIDGIKVKDLSPARIGSIYRGQQLIVFGHYWGHGTGEVTLTAKVAGEKKTYSSRFDFPQQSNLNPEVERLWAYATIEDIQNRIDYLGEDADSRQAIVDIATEYGLVTNYTSMIVVREEVFEQYKIDRNNQKRVGKEHAARAQRAAGAVRNNRVDSQQPAFSSPRAYPNNSGGGAMGPWLLLLLLPLLAARKRGRH